MRPLMIARTLGILSNYVLLLEIGDFKGVVVNGNQQRLALIIINFLRVQPGTEK